MNSKKIREIVLATNNQGKVREIEKILSPLSVEFLNLESFPALKPPEETGETFAENALLKAQYYFDRLKKPALADDSGLEVQYLGGGPGVFTARFAGDNITDEERNEALLQKLQGVPLEQRGASFVCVAALVLPWGEHIITRGELKGFIATAPEGEDGFGFDPVFFLPHYDQTMAQIGQEKNRISHRARAMKAMREKIIEMDLL